MSKGYDGENQAEHRWLNGTKVRRIAELQSRIDVPQKENATIRLVSMAAA